jgi:LPS export ABC transporter protein LptC
MLRSPAHSQSLLVARNIGLGILTFVGMQTIYVYVVKVIAADPFARLREEANTGIQQNVGIRLDDVRINAYRDGKLITSAQTDRVEISTDRQMFTLTGIHDGVFKQDGKSYRYEANEGVWLKNSRRLTLSGSARIQDADLDLRTSELEFDEGMHSLRTLQPISGRFYHGTLAARGFHMDTKTEAYDTGPVDYSGDLAMLNQASDDEGQTAHLWHYAGEGTKVTPATKTTPSITYYLEGKAWDDETILKADLVAQYKGTDVLVATGSVKYFSAKADITADKATIYQKEKRVVLVGHVTVYVKPKSDEKKPPVEEQTPAFARLNPDQVSGPTDKLGKAPMGPQGTPSTGDKVLRDGSLPGGHSGASPGAVSSGGTTSPGTASPGTTTRGADQTSAGGSAGQNPTTTSKPQDTKSVPKKAGDAQKGGVDQKQKKETPEEKKLDEELRNGKTLRKYPMVILCDQIEYWYGKGERHGHAIGSPQGRQELPGARWRDVWSTAADYDGEKDELTLMSTPGKIDVRMKNSKGDDVTALQLTVSTKEDADEEVYRARKATAVGLVDTDDDTTADTKKNPAPNNSRPGGPAGSGAPVKTGSG